MSAALADGVDPRRVETVDFHKVLILMDRLRYGEGTYMGSVRCTHEGLSAIRFGWAAEVLGCTFDLELTERTGHIPVAYRMSGRNWALSFRFNPVPQFFLQPPPPPGSYVSCLGFLGAVRDATLTGSFEAFQSDLLISLMALPQERLTSRPWHDVSQHAAPTPVIIIEENA